VNGRPHHVLAISSDGAPPRTVYVDRQGGAGTPAPPVAAVEAEALDAARCIMCHGGGAPRAARREVLGWLSLDAIRLALTSGSMRAQGADLTGAQIDALARMLARGGSLDGPGPVVAVGKLFVNSGYAFVGGMPGNVLLAYSRDGR
jgi:hypothetical protein